MGSFNSPPRVHGARCVQILDHSDDREQSLDICLFRIWLIRMGFIGVRTFPPRAYINPRLDLSHVWLRPPRNLVRINAVFNAVTSSSYYESQSTPIFHHLAASEADKMILSHSPLHPELILRTHSDALSHGLHLFVINYSIRV